MFTVSSEDAGNYHCTGWITGTPLNSSLFQITVTAGGKLGHLFLHCRSRNVAVPEHYSVAYFDHITAFEAL